MSSTPPAAAATNAEPQRAITASGQTSDFPLSDLEHVGDDGIVVRRVRTLAEYQACMALQDDIWGPGFAELVPSAILMVAQKMGGVCAGAFAPEGRLLGFVFGISGVRHGEWAHWSDMLAVRPEARGLSLGDRLKRFQRELCVAAGMRTMYWTFDPLVARNAHLNLMRLGAECAEYVVDMYGSSTGSPLHGALPTDRWIARWDLTRAPTSRSSAPTPSGLYLVHSEPSGDRPIEGPSLTDAAVRRAPALRVAVPADHEVLSLESRRAWRWSTRRAFTEAMASGYRVAGFHRATPDAPPFYELTRASTASDAPS